jgi:hypothetical protein
MSMSNTKDEHLSNEMFIIIIIIISNQKSTFLWANLLALESFAP